MTDFRLLESILKLASFALHSGGHNNGCGTNGAHPDNGWYGFQSDSDYNNLGAGGEGSGNKAWHRWGIPGQVIQGGKYE